ncbi:MAG TPA: FdhF/YdeP family oxidoreductase [Acidimicrobiia bacterium]|nr:FdhF/YdeP family oxidoreductase [Acidimicrobiia bacterium]
MAWPGSARRHAPRHTRRSLWVGFRPYGVGETKPNHYADILQAAWDNRDNLRYAWRILRRGVCDGCALGVAGFHDWTLAGPHLCATRLHLLRVNTMGALDPAVLADVDDLRKRSGAELRALGRLPYPMRRDPGDAGFRRITWDEALELLASSIRATTPDRLAIYLTARGLTNEAYYVAQKAARFLGTNNIDNAARVCHAPSTLALKQAIGVGATTCSYTDVIDSDLIVLFGANVANAQPVFMKYLYLARKRGAQVVVVNPLREPGLDRYWVPSNVESAMFGTRMADDFVPVHTGGDVAFINGVLKHLLADGTLDRAFIRHHTAGFDDLLAELERERIEDLEAAAGVPRATMAAFARRYGAARSAVLVWSMGITQHEQGVDNVAAIVNLALARGNVGRRGAGLMPIRGHSGVQGGAEMGAYATALPGGGPVTAAGAAALSEQYGFPVPATPGLTAEAMLEAAERGDLDVLWTDGGNFLDVLPDPPRVAEALGHVPLRVHQDIVVSSQMLVGGGTVVLLPAATRYEQRDGGTETTTERRIVFSPEVPGPRVGEARSEWEIFGDVARRVHPERADQMRCASGAEIRAEIAAVVPSYAGIERLGRTGDAIQWGGPHLCVGGAFPTDDGRGHFTAVAPRPAAAPGGPLRLSTRRGKQFNTMVLAARDPLTGAGRDAVFLAETDAAARHLRDGDAVVVRSPHGELRGHVHVAPLRAGNVQVYFPEGNVLLALGRRGASGVPDYTTDVEILAAP